VKETTILFFIGTDSAEIHHCCCN